jgi:hypothetical protein
MAVLSGKAGTLKLAGASVTPVSNWKLSLTSNNKAYAANDTGGCKSRVPGVQDSSGSFECKVSDSGHCPVAAGDQVTAQLHVDGSGANYYELPIIIDRIQVDVDINDGQIMAFAIDFSGCGAATAHGIVAQATGGGT